MSMKVVLTVEEAKNIICDFVHGRNLEDEKPKEVVFIHKYYDGSGESDVGAITPIDRIEVRY